MTMPGGHGPWTVMRSYRQDKSVTEQKLPKGTARRIAGFARPYRADLVVFLVTVIGSAVIGVITPVLAGRVVNVISSHGAPATVVKIAIVVAGLALVDACLSLAQRWY
jgi:ATP-binding cassette, subfamily B, bacterial